jgi:type II secretory pathway pseudopilin PulG
MLLKKGAMFGLDARIALAIFGALSVISGAALYSAIQDSKVTSLIADMNEIGKALDAYQLDTGQLPPFHSTARNYMDAMELVESSVTGWNGPYYSGEQSGTTHPQELNIKYPAYDYIGLRRMTTGTWAAIADAMCVDASKNPCAIYTLIAIVPKAVADGVDEKVDGSLSPNDGNVRVYSDDGTNWSLWMKYRPYTYE